MFTKNVYILHIEYYIARHWRHASLFSFSGNNSIKVGCMASFLVPRKFLMEFSCTSSNNMFGFFFCSVAMFYTIMPLRCGIKPIHKRTDIIFKKITIEYFSNIIRLFKSFSFELLIRLGSILPVTPYLLCFLLSWVRLHMFMKSTEHLINNIASIWSWSWQPFSWMHTTNSCFLPLPLKLMQMKRAFIFCCCCYFSVNFPRLTANNVKFSK